MKITDEAVQEAIEGYNKTSRIKLQENELMRNALNAALPYLQAGYKVKKLEWSDGAWNTIRSETVFGAYVINSHDGGEFYWALPGVLTRRTQSVDEAKAAAQADFERRVNECIDRLREASPVDVAEVRGMVEQLIKAADEIVLHFGDNDSGFSIPSVNEADYICTSLGDYHEARAKLVSLIGDLSAAPTEEEG